ncbi:hypothetical protein RIF29_35950 [Crotalaria pallida]|uniref:Dof zinc finger protein n=1 Tax=Crotalaria pallida TaxID=3830 RepID=A0AAN9EAV3_CROPI
MGLSSKQVSSGGLDWNNNLLESQKLELLPKPHHQMKKQQQQQQSEQQSSETLKCPRCDSSNTKFCYYNNYNKSQPRHFCRACKRHWTKGGTLRNVPVGGGRKNKRNKKPTTPTTTTTTTSTITNTTSTCTTSFANTNNTTMNSNIQTTTPLAMLSDHKNIIASSSLYQALIRPPPSLLLQQQRNNNNNLMNMRDLSESGKDFGSMILSSSSQNQSLLFPFSTSISSSFYTNPCSVSTTSLRSSSNVYNYVEESTINSVIPPSTTSAAATNTQLWEMLPAATTSGGTGTGTGMGMSNYWSWEDIDSLVSTDLKDPWDDSDIKPFE